MATSKIEEINEIKLFGWKDIKSQFTGSPKQYTAPDNCIVYMCDNAASGDVSYWNLHHISAQTGKDTALPQVSDSYGGSAQIYIPCKKGDIIKFNSSYAVGSGTWYAYLM